jgi:predicted DNA-binding transcriptional regulator YafY
MRASRLLSILTTLQARGRVTAPELAEACEVSVRTIYRDVDALSAAGIPVYAERGAGGGFRLLDGYRVRLNGLSLPETDALFLAGLPGPAAALGLDGAMSAAQDKLVAALPAALRESATRMQARFHLDAPGWFGEAEEPQHLRAIADALLADRLIEIRYQSWRAEKRRRVAPLGLVLKGGNWYLAGRVGDDVRTYRVARILDCAVQSESFARSADFDLGSLLAQCDRAARGRDASARGDGAALAAWHQAAGGVDPALCESAAAHRRRCGCKWLAHRDDSDRHHRLARRRRVAAARTRGRGAGAASVACKDDGADADDGRTLSRECSF